MNRVWALALLLPLGLVPFAGPDRGERWADISNAAIELHEAGLFAKAMAPAEESLGVNIR